MEADHRKDREDREMDTEGEKGIIPARAVGRKRVEEEAPAENNRLRTP